MIAICQDGGEQLSLERCPAIAATRFAMLRNAVGVLCAGLSSALMSAAWAGQHDLSSEVQFESFKTESPYKDWRRSFFQQEAQSAGTASYSFADEFGGRPGETTAGLAMTLGARWTSLLETSYVNNASALAEWSMLGQVGTQLGAGWDIEAGLRYSELSLRGLELHRADAQMGALTLAKSWDGTYRSQYTLYTARRDGGAPTSGHRIALNYLYGSNSSVGFAYDRSWAADMPLSLPLGNVNVTSNMGVVGEHWITRAWSVNYDALFQQGSLQGFKPEIRIGLKLAF